MCSSFLFFLSINNHPEQCPAGASCRDSLTFDNVQPLFGWSQCPSLIDNRVRFEKCVFGAACLGQANPLLAGKFLGEDGEDPATIDNNASCFKDYKNGSLLCAACAKGYSHSTNGNKCK
jgi:hypothetical protein